MTKRLNISFDSDLLEAISADFDLRAPNREALRQLVFALDGDYDPEVQQVLNLATGVGKTYLMAAFVEYLRCQGVGNVVIVTPGKTVQAKTVQNFTPGAPKFITGSPVPPEVVTPQDYSAWINRTNGAARLSHGREVPVLAFIFNIQQLIAPKDVEGDTHGGTQDAMRRKPRRFDENAGVLFDYLKDQEDLVVIADESHLYGTTAKAFNAALRELEPAASIGLTASVDKKKDHVIFEYPLYQAIKDQYVKAPVLAFRKDGYGTDQASEEQQLRDALQLRGIKQAFYDSYASNNNRNSVNAVVFIVCSDVEHATQVADLLRTPEYFGRDSAVLQVDNQHDDDATQQLLNRLDQPDSPVLAVVSVNKLKEGWDVKNIAVVVTLRAMASEVLTQQTMGRGLRLPFGRYTGVSQIDQLDIIAHQSFKELLAAENVLQQFGLDEAVKDTDQEEIEKAIRKAVEGGGSAEGEAPTVGGASAIQLATATGQQPGGIDAPATGRGQEIPETDWQNPGVGVRLFDDNTAEGSVEWEIVSVDRNPAFADVSYHFPVTTITVQQPPIELSEIADEQIEQAARRVTSAGDVMYRKEIIAAVGKGLRVADVESAEVDSIPIPDDDAHQALTKLIMNMSLVPKTEPMARYIDTYLVPKFMKHVPFDDWTVKSLASAQLLLQQLVHAYVVNTLRSTSEVPSIYPKRLPGDGYSLPLGERIHDQIDSRDEFVRGRAYGGWFKSLFEAEHFDSYSGEYQLAKLLNISPNIEWWHRLHPQDNAFIYFNSKDRYFPDFVAKDTEGVHWIIEGKSERGRDDAQVQAKRLAAESLVRRMIADDAYVGQHWGYLIAYEKDIAKSESWSDLKALAQPISNCL
ncbi:DEAD/DEAH box helicase family protein [Brevibacterium sp. UMB1308A]|uniref:DEAD/DEAH box helicase family protein n=1 Tax=Brevibacterium sp. UMB1308A TaxID=3050608 RepID=UPI00254DD143|nr:DEAD/DEAH box helicase family protein [Brevibacterium sp. UMB1308A]MDK8345246.1 DEAD/DEAH box helicase family protein [Brevibacterium sp. UMB1308B]MDK8713893.1 DEAD/DEAH box helicase family protein [Brevibacterium sp. UMB1308A]